MNKISGLSNDGAQTISIVLSDGSRANLSIFFRPQQDGWFFNVSWPGATARPVPFACNGRRLVASQNLLRQYADVLKWGLACFTTDGLDPSGQNSFAEAAATLVLLEGADLAAVEASALS